MVLFAFLSISCISAAEDNQTDCVALQNDTGDILTDTPGTLATLDKEIKDSPNGYTLERDYEYFQTVDKKLKDGIVIDRDNYVIDGNGHTIDGFDGARIFKVTANNVVIKNVVFKRASCGSGGTGGAVRFEKPGTLIGCEFNNCSAPWGAAAYFGGDGVVKNCVFNSNRGDHSDYATYGTLYFVKKGTVEGCTFTSNVASYGAAICFRGERGTVKNSSFINNTANIHSGAILFNAYAEIENCTFDGNYAPRYGACYLFEYGSIANSTFKRNRADSEGIVNFESGGTIAGSTFEGNDLTGGTGMVVFHSNSGNINDSVFKSNNAETGGAVYMTSGTIANSKFYSNTATNGGAVYMISGTITGCEFNSNTATNGGGVYCKGKSVLRNNRFKDNTVNLNGGGVYFENVASSENDTFIDNYANNGGGIYFKMFGNVTNGSFYDDWAYYGGGVYCSAGVAIDGSNFTMETAGSGGAVYLAQSGTGTIDHSNFNHDNALIGGAVYSECNLKISNSVFEDNTGLYDTFNLYLGENANLEYHNVTPNLLFLPTFKGLNYEIMNCQDNYLLLEDDYNYDSDYDSKFKNGIIIDKPNLTIDGNGHTINGEKIARIFQITAENVTLININIINGAPADRVGGTVIFNKPGTVINCHFTNNNAIVGGAIQFNDDGVVVNSTFKSNTAEYDGGAIQFRKTGKVSNSKFLNNRANSNGGAILFGDEGSLTNCEFKENEAQSNGGAVYSFFNLDISVSIKNSTFTDNAAETGGALFLNCPASIEDSGFGKNHATCNGGAIYFFEEGKLENCNFSSNYAQNGAAMYCTYKTTLSNCNLNANNATADGGAIYSDHHININNCRLTNNKAMDGGALYATLTGKISRSHLENNTADCGGAICNYGDLAVEHSSFMDNFASEGTNHISMKGSGKLTLDNITPQNIGPFKVAKIRVAYVENTTYGGIVRIGVLATAYGKPMNEGNASVTIDDETYFANLEGGSAVIEIPNIRVGYYTINVCLDGGEKYTRDYAEATFRVARENATVDIGIVRNSTYGRNVTIVAIVTNPTSTITEGVLIFEVENRTYRANVETGVCRFAFSDFDVGIYTGILTFDGGLDYYGATGNVTFQVDPASVNLNFDEGNYIYGHAVKINVSVTANGNAIDEGNVTVNINKEKHTSQVINGTAIIQIEGLDAGMHFGSVSYSGTANYKKPVKSISFFVNPETVELDFNVSDITYGETVKINVSVTADGKAIDEGNVTVIINNETYVESVIGGRATIEIRNLNVTGYSGNISYNGGTNYESQSKLISFNVNPIPVDLNFNVSDITYGETVLINVSVTADGKAIDEGNVTVIVNNEIYVESVVGGRATIEIENLNATRYSGNINYNGGTNYNRPSKLISFNVKPITVDLDFEVCNVTCGETVKITANVTAEGKEMNEGNVTVTISNRTYSAPVTNGTATIEMPGLDAGTYEGILTYDGNENYNCTPKAVNFSVNKQDATIIAFDKSYVINYADKYSITVKDINGNALSGQKVTFALNGKDIGSAVTNDQGVAAIDLTAKILKAAKAGKRDLVINFAGDNIYNAASKTVKITINKEKTKIAAKKKTFKKSKKVKKYKITLKDSKGNAIKKAKVTIKIKKKTYKAKTNSKGKATFKIKKLTKKGTYKAKVTYKGNDCYKKATKTVKIKIK